MATVPDIKKLAPNLSVEERYKIVIPEAHRIMSGETPVLSDSEITALTFFEKATTWEDYAKRIGIFKWVNFLWTRDIEKEKFSVCTCILLLHFQFAEVIEDGDRAATKEEKEKHLETLRHFVFILEEQLVGFYSYRHAIARLEEECYGTPLFRDEIKKAIEEYYALVDGEIDRHNKLVKVLCENKSFKKHFKPIAQDIDKYLVTIPTVDENKIAELIRDIKSLADSDIQARK